MTTPLDRLKFAVGTHTPRYLWAHSNAILPHAVKDILDEQQHARKGWHEIGPTFGSDYAQLSLKLSLDHHPMTLPAIIRFAVLWPEGGVLVPLASCSTDKQTLYITPWDQPAMKELK